MTLVWSTLAPQWSPVSLLATGALHQPVRVSIVLYIIMSYYSSRHPSKAEIFVFQLPIFSSGPPSVYLSLSSTNYLSGLPETSLSSVGEEGGLVCRTNLPDCCESERGNWYHPNGSVIVMTEGVLYVRRGDRRISLHLSSGAPPDTRGLYCCEVPVTGGIDSTCIILSEL